MSYLDDLKAREEKAEEDLRRLEEAEEIAKNIANLERAQHSKAGTIKRMVSTFGALSPVDAIYKANEAAFKRDGAGYAASAFGRTFAKSYASSISNNLKTAWTDKDYTTQQKTYRDIIEKQMGMKKGAASATLGIVGDIATDPLNFIGTPAFKIVSKTAGVIGTGMKTLAAKAPAIEKGMDALARQFNIFHDIEKTKSPEFVKQFKQAFTKAVESGDFLPLRKMGVETTPYTKVKFPKLTNVEKEIFKKSLQTTHGKSLSEIADINLAKQTWAAIDSKRKALVFGMPRLREINGRFTSSKEVNALMKEAFAPEGPTSKIGKTLDKYLGTPLDTTSNVFKRIMSWSPKFQTRNAMGALIQGLSEMPTRTFSDLKNVGKYYYDAFKMVKTGGKSNPQVWEEALEHGLTKSTGMFEQTLDKFPAKVANFGESVNRIALLLSAKAGGKSLSEAVEQTQKVFYKYNKAYLSGTEKNVLSRIFPFYQFGKGQLQYWLEALGRNAAKWTGLGRIKEGTKSDSEREYPFLSPEYWKNMFSVGSVGNIGFQLEDFLKNATGDVKNMWGQLQPLLKGTLEFVTDWKVFQGKRLSTDTGPDRYQNLPEPLRKLVGYDATKNTANPYLKWLIESIAGPILDPIKNVFDPKKSLASVFTSIREYNLDPRTLSRQQLRQNQEDAKGGFLDNFARRFGGSVGPSSASAAIPVRVVGGTGFKSAQGIADWEATYGGGVVGSFGTVRNPDDASNAQDLEYRSRQAMLQNVIKIAADATNDIGVNAENVHKLELRQIYEKYKYEGKLGTQQHKQEMEWAKAKYRTTAPRTYDQDPYLDIATRDKYRRSPGNSAINQFRNKALDEFVAERSKIMELNRSLVVTSPESLQRERDADLKGLELKYKTQYGYMSKKDYEDHAKAIVEKYGRAVADLEAKGKTAMATLLEQWAKSEINSFQKIELERQAALTKFKGTDDYRIAEAAKNLQYIKSMEDAINAEHDQKRRDRLAKEAKAHMEHVRMITKGQAEVVIQALEDIYKRGGKTIKDFYGEKLAIRSNQYSQDATSAINLAQQLLQSGMKEAPGSIEGRKVNYTVEPMQGKKLGAEKIKQISDDFAEVIKISKTLDEFYEKLGVFNASAKGVKIDIDILNAEKNNAKDAFDNLEAIKKIFLDPKADISQRINAVKEALKQLAQKLQGVDPVAIEEAVKTLSSAADNLTNESNAAGAGITTDTATLNRAITDLHANAAKLRSQVYATTGIRTLGLRSTSGASTKFGYNTTPFAPTGYNRDAEALKTELDSVDASASQFFQKNTDTEGELAFKAKTIDQSDSGYLMQIETELQKHENNKANISETGKKKLEALQENYAAFVMTSENKIAISQEQVMQKRLTTAGDMAGMMTQTAEMIYEATGKQSKEAFYAMKALAIAEATIKGVQSVISAFKAGNDVGGPTVGAAYAAIASAFVGTQVGILTSQMVNGPEAKAEGGPIKGGSGRRDDVPILAMGGEYVIRKSSVSKYGANFLDALNKGVIPVSAFNFSIPSPPIYDTNQVHFADGGLVGVHKPTPVTVELKNESGTPLKQTKSDVNFNGQEYVVTVWLDALERNVGGLRSALGG